MDIVLPPVGIVQPIMDPGKAGKTAAYGGMGAIGPIGGITFTAGSPQLLATVRLASSFSGIMKIDQFSIQPVIFTGYTTGRFVTVAFRKCTNYTAISTSAGTDVSSYFGAPKNSNSPAVSNIEARVAGVPGSPSSTPLAFGTRTPLNVLRQQTFYCAASVVGEKTTLVVALAEPLCLVANEGVEFLLYNLYPTAADATGYMSFTIDFDWRVETE